MVYRRVVPRDLFNESKLLKCMGQLALLIHDGQDKNGRPTPKLNLEHDGEDFDIDLDPMVDGLYANNVKIIAKGQLLRLYSAYNSKEAYTLMCYDDEIGEIEVFNNDGTLTDEFIEYVT